MMDLNIINSVQPPFNNAIWSSWHILMNGEICFAILIIRLMARSVKLITLIKLFGSAVADA